MRKNTKKESSTPKDPQKESVFRQLSEILGKGGYVVRREKLKTGPGWKVVSGACMAKGEKFIFVDRRMPQDDQIGFLVNQIGTRQIVVDAEVKAHLPELIARQLP